MSELERLSREWHDLLERYDALVAETYGRRLPCREAEVAQKRYERAEADADTQFKLRAQAEAEVALRDRMLRDIIERIALTPERWNGWTTAEVLADLRATNVGAADTPETPQNGSGRDATPSEGIDRHMPSAGRQKRSGGRRRNTREDS